MAKTMLKPKGVAMAPTKKKKGKTETNWMLHIVAATALAFSAVYIFSDAPSDAKRDKRNADIVYEDVPSYEETHPEIHAMVKWVESNGGSIDKRITIRDGEYNRGVYLYGGSMTRTERGKARFMEIPESLFLSPKSLLDPKSTFGKTVNDQELIDKLIKEGDQLQLAVMMMVESNNPDSFWRPYFDTMNKSEMMHAEKGSPFLWSDEQLTEIQSPLILESIQKKNLYIKEKLPLVKAIAERYPDLFPDNSNLASDLTWFFHLTHSRSFGFQDKRGGKKIVNVMVPILDLTNGSFREPNVRIADNYKDDVDTEVYGKEENGESQSETFFATLVTAKLKKLPHGGELLLSYGTSSQAYLLEKYGVVDNNYENNTNGDYVSLKMPGADWRVHSDGTFDFFKVQLLTKDSTKHEVTPNELLGKVQERLENLPTTLDQDKELLNSPDDEVTFIPHNALLVRIRFKQVLHNMINFLEAGAPTPPNMKYLTTRGALFELDLSEAFIFYNDHAAPEEYAEQEEDDKQEEGVNQEAGVNQEEDVER